MEVMALLTSFHLIPNMTRFGLKGEIVLSSLCDVISVVVNLVDGMRQNRRSTYIASQ